MAGTEIRSITARQVYTNRGNPGVEAVVTMEMPDVHMARPVAPFSVVTPA